MILRTPAYIRSLKGLAYPKQDMPIILAKYLISILKLFVVRGLVFSLSCNVPTLTK